MFAHNRILIIKKESQWNNQKKWVTCQMIGWYQKNNAWLERHTKIRHHKVYVVNLWGWWIGKMCQRPQGLLPPLANRPGCNNRATSLASLQPGDHEQNIMHRFRQWFYHFILTVDLALLSTGECVLEIDFCWTAMQRVVDVLKTYVTSHHPMCEWKGYVLS